MITVNNSYDLTGQVAIVTGATSGLGWRFAQVLAASGASVVATGRRQERLNELVATIVADGGQAVGVPIDMTDAESIVAAVDQAEAAFGTVTILVNNAGITKDKSMKKLTDDDWNDVLDTNLGSVYATCSEVLKIMMDQKYGRIINITSFVGQAGNFGQANYAASKGGIIAFTKTLALEMAKYNITVNAIAPGFTETEMLAQVPENIRQQIIARVPMGRFGQPEEIARAVVFLAAEGDYITGQQINVNGGVYM